MWASHRRGVSKHSETTKPTLKALGQRGLVFGRSYDTLVLFVEMLNAFAIKVAQNRLQHLCFDGSQTIC